MYFYPIRFCSPYSLVDEAERLEDQQAEAHREALIAAQGTDGLAEDLSAMLSEAS